MVKGLNGVLSDFKAAEPIARGWIEITSTITPELYSTQSYYITITYHDNPFFNG